MRHLPADIAAVHAGRPLPRAGGSWRLTLDHGAVRLSLAAGRVHELCGPSRRTLAVMIAAAGPGPVLWIAPGWQPERLYPDGMTALAAPGRFVFVACPRAEDLQWCAEEALRSGAVPLVVVEFPAPPGLTAVRRLHLAASARSQPDSPAAAARASGGFAGPVCGGGAEAPLGLILTPGRGGAPGVESRWHMAPLPLRTRCAPVPPMAAAAPATGAPPHAAPEASPEPAAKAPPRSARAPAPRGAEAAPRATFETAAAAAIEAPAPHVPPDAAVPAGRARWRLERLRARHEPPAVWHLCDIRIPGATTRA